MSLANPGEPGLGDRAGLAQGGSGRHGLDDLEVDLDLGLGAAGSHDDAGPVGQVVAQALGRGQPAVAPSEVVDSGDRDAGHRRGRL